MSLRRHRHWPYTVVSWTYLGAHAPRVTLALGNEEAGGAL